MKKDLKPAELDLAAKISSYAVRFFIFILGSKYRNMESAI
jgi:hypothetical protein